MARNGPLIPGIEEFDRPRPSPFRWVFWAVGVIVVAAIVIVGLGLFAGIGPLRSLGMTTEELTVVSWRPTDDPDVIQLGVAIPEGGLCPNWTITGSTDDLGNVVEVAAALTKSRSESCEQAVISTDRTYIEAKLENPVDGREVVRVTDKVVVPGDLVG